MTDEVRADFQTLWDYMHMDMAPGPADCIAAGNPCRVLRKITEADRKYYYKDRVFDVEDY